MIKTSSSFLVKTGVAYAFMSSDSTGGWQMSNYGIDSKNSFPGQTLAHLYKDAVSENHVSEPSVSFLFFLVEIIQAHLI